MNVSIVRATLKEEHVEEATAAVRRMFAAIEREQVEGIRYASVQLQDGVTFVAMLEVEDGIENPLFALPEAKEFYEKLPQWYVEPPEFGPGTVIGSYRLFSGAATPA
jgi:hypothetical protein